jgi:exonuclease SbcC
MRKKIMKFRVKKLYLENFKGLKGKHTVEFGQRATLLFGPNGYGKTTIFDALELLLTGRIARIENENNEHGAKRHESSVIHNEKDSQVLLKLLIESDNVDSVIIRRFPESTQRLGLDKFWQELETYIATGADIDAALGRDSISINQEELEKQLFGDNNQEYLSQYFRLLTYVPQAEAIYFLKMSQNERHSKLSPLLDMSEQSNLLEALRGYRIKLFALKNYLEDKLKEYDNVPENTPKETVPYSRLTNTSEIAIYDESNPYKGLNISLAKEKRVRINEEIEEVKDFLDSFKPKEFAKLKINLRLTEIFKNDTFIDYFIFKDTLGKDLSSVEQNYQLSLAARSKSFPLKFILHKHLANKRYEELEKMRLSYLKYRSVLYDDLGEKRNTKSMLIILGDKSNGFTVETQLKASRYLDEYSLLEKSVNSSQQLLKQLQEYRNHVISHSRKLKLTVNLKDCPLCGYDWASETSLIESIKQKTDTLQLLIGTEAKSLIDKERLIKIEFLDDLSSKGALYLEKNSLIYNSFNKIRQYAPLTDDDNLNFSLLLKLVPEAKDLVIDVDDFSADLNSKVQKLDEIINSKVSSFDREVITRLRNVGSYNFSSDDKFIAESGLKLTKTDIDARKILSLSIDGLKERREKYRKEVYLFMEKNEVDSNSVVNSYLFKNLFSEKDDLFQKAKKELGPKIKYLKQQFSVASMQSRKKYQREYAVIAPLSDKMYDLSKSFDGALKKYQFSLTQPLKSPFYVYSAKILQNNPNGQGIFIKTDSDSSTIVFCANASTSHDALHQLSSGQLAVVSMAFHLSMNAVYTTKSLNLLIIDDPIQDMDSLNVHSFSELLRREFAKDYQIIMSTHDDLDMQYLKYMFGKALEADDIKAWNVQELFYKS